MAGTVVLETQIPEDIFKTLQAHGMHKTVLAKSSRQLLAVRFYQDQVLSLGNAARHAGMGLWDFIEFLSTHDVSVIDYSEEELAAEFEAVEQLAGE